MAYTNSSMVVYTKLSPNHSGQRTHGIDRITPHCVVGQATAERICDCFISPDRQASCNYIRTLKKQQEVMHDWNDTIWTVMIEKAIVHKDGQITFVFQNGTGIKVGA